MIEIVNKINRNDLNSLLENKYQSEMSADMVEFARDISNIIKIEDLKKLDKKFYEYFKMDNSTKKFTMTASEIFERKTFSGCSDIGLAIAPILRYLNIPTVYLESAHIDWIKDVQDNSENKELMRGHIFLEVYLNDKWYLYDPTAHLVYDNYDYNNYYLPKGYIAFAKGLNSFDIGVCSVSDEKALATRLLKDIDVSKYIIPNYNEYKLDKS